MKTLARVLAVLLVLCLLPGALADTALDDVLNDPHAAPTATPLPTDAPADDGTHQIPSQEEDPHAEPSLIDTAQPESTGHFDPTPTVSPEEFGYDLDGVLAGLPESLSAISRKQVEIYLRGLLSLKAKLDAALDAVPAMLADGEAVAAWQELLYFVNIAEPMRPELEGVRFYCPDATLDACLLAQVHAEYLVPLPVDLSSAYYLMGYIALEESEPKMAVDRLALAAEYAPTSSYVLAEYITALKEAKRADEAAPLLPLALEYALEPEQLARAYRELGYAAVEAGDLRYAASLYTVSKEFSADDSAAEGELAYIAEQDAKALDGLTLAEAKAALAEQGVSFGLSETAQKAIDQYKVDYADAPDEKSEAILELWK